MSEKAEASIPNSPSTIRIPNITTRKVTVVPETFANNWAKVAPKPKE